MVFKDQWEPCKIALYYCKSDTVGYALSYRFDGKEVLNRGCVESTNIAGRKTHEARISVGDYYTLLSLRITIKVLSR